MEVRLESRGEIEGIEISGRKKEGRKKEICERTNLAAARFVIARGENSR